MLSLACCLARLGKPSRKLLASVIYTSRCDLVSSQAHLPAQVAQSQGYARQGLHRNPLALGAGPPAWPPGPEIQSLSWALGIDFPPPLTVCGGWWHREHPAAPGVVAGDMLGVSCALEGVHSSQEWLCPPMLVLAAGGKSPSVSTGVRPAAVACTGHTAFKHIRPRSRRQGTRSGGLCGPRDGSPRARSRAQDAQACASSPASSSLARQTLTPGLELPMDTTLALGHGQGACRGCSSGRTGCEGQTHLAS